MRRRQQPKTSNPLKVLLTNGRFPTSLDLARQLKLAGHDVYVVDCMHYHVCKFSVDVQHSFRVAVPREDPAGFIEGVVHAVNKANIDLIIPMHEEIFYLAYAARSEQLESVSEEPSSTNFNAQMLRKKLFAPPFDILLRLHNKWEFSKYLISKGLDTPRTHLCTKYDDVQRLDPNVEWALKPVYGRASTNVFHLKPGSPLPRPGEDGFIIDEQNQYVAQEWIHGQRYCTYAVLQDGHVAAFSVYPVQDTIDGSSCVFFEAINKPQVRGYFDRLAATLPNVSGQLALDLIETENPEHRLVAIECNPRATSGIHLYSGTTTLALAMTCRKSMDTPCRQEQIPDHASAKDGARRQLAPGMLMWKRSKTDKCKAKATLKEYLLHMKHLVSSRDVIFSGRDLLPSLMQPFLLTSYYEICREKKLKLPTMFQYDLVWEPKGDELNKVTKILADMEGSSVIS